MLEISHDLVQEIAKRPTKHSWAQKLMELPEDKADRAEARMDKWIARTMKELHPEADQAERAVRIIWLHLMEREAIEDFCLCNPRYLWIIPVVYNAEGAVDVAALDIMGLSDTDKAAAVHFLEMMEDGVLTPSLKEILE
jgi:hypothetical protein